MNTYRDEIEAAAGSTKQHQHLEPSSALDLRGLLCQDMARMELLAN